jgi:RNA polymerase sigma factor (sigma-70 family)
MIAPNDFFRIKEMLEVFSRGMEGNALNHKGYIQRARLMGMEDPENFVLETYIHVAQHACASNPRLGAYINKTFIRGAIDNFRRKKEVRIEEIPGFDVKREDNPILYLIEEEQRKAVYEGVNRLPMEQRKLIMMRYYLGMTGKEISRSTGLPEGTVYNRLSETRKRLKSDIVLLERV